MTDPDAPASGIARGMRQLPAELPDDPAPEQVDAWVELAELAAHEDFRLRVRAMAVAGQRTQAQQVTAPDYHAVTEHAGQARAQGIAPGSPEGKSVLDRIIAPDVPAARRAELLKQLETFTDARVERYWQLLAIINGQPVPPSVVPSFEWLIAELSADLSRPRDLPAYSGENRPGLARRLRHPDPGLTRGLGRLRANLARGLGGLSVDLGGRLGRLGADLSRLGGGMNRHCPANRPCNIPGCIMAG